MVTGWLSLSCVILIPLLGGLACLGPWFARECDAGGRLCRTWSLAVSALTLLLLLVISESAKGAPDVLFSVSETRAWIPSLGIYWRLTLDGLSLPFTLLTCVVSLAVVAWSVRPAQAGAGWYALLLIGQSAVLGAFLATDLVVFYCFYEAMLLPVLAAMALWGGPRRLQAALKFLLYTVTGSVLMFLAILFIGWKAINVLATDGAHAILAFDVTTLSSANMFSPEQQLLLGLAFLVAFAVKTPIVPLHGWLPEMYREAPHGTAAFTAALLGKVGIYGIIRFAMPLFPDFMQAAAPVLAALGAIGIAYGAAVAMAQRDVRSLLAYSSISHLGFCVLGIAAATELAVTGAVFQAVSHGLVTVALFLVFGAITEREGTRDLDSLGGLAAKIPVGAFFLMVFSIAAVALPLTSSFVGEFLVIIGSWDQFPQWTSLALVGVVIGAVYTLTAYLKVMFGPLRERSGETGGDLKGGDVLVLSALAALVILLGIFPQRALSSISSAVEVRLAQAASQLHEGEAKAQLRVPAWPAQEMIRPARMQADQVQER